MSVQVSASAAVSSPGEVRMINGVETAPTFPFSVQFSDPESVDAVQVWMTREAAQSLLVKLANALGREVHDANEPPF